MMARHGMGLGGILVATAIVGGVFGSGRTITGAGPASAGSVQIVILAVAVFGIAFLATKYLADRVNQLRDETTASADSEAALEALKRRYADGELDEIEFERKLELLFETETVADADRRVETRSVSDEQRPRQELPSGSEEQYLPRSDSRSERKQSRSRRGHCH